MTELKILQGDCLEVLKTLDDNSIDSVVTDPPYGLFHAGARGHREAVEVIKAWAGGDWEYQPRIKHGYQGSDWDAFVPSPAVWAECLRVLKPGGHIVAFAGSRTIHLMGVGLSLAGFEIRDSLVWIHGNGFPRSLDYGNEIKKMGDEELGQLYWDFRSELKTSNEPMILARKPLSEPSISKNILEHGTGALNVGECRFGDFKQKQNGAPTGRAMLAGAHSVEHLRELAARDAKLPDGKSARTTLKRVETWQERQARTPVSKPGRWPGNVIIDDDVASELQVKSSYFFHPRVQNNEIPKTYAANGDLIQHQTVKPLGLMAWLVKLVTPPGGTVLDPFAGSGSTIVAAQAEKFAAIGIEVNPDYVELAQSRLEK